MEERTGQKTELRKRILKERNALSALQRQEWDGKILEHLIRYDKENPCAAYLCYVNYRSEVSTKEFILRCLDRGKNVFVPKVQEPAKTGDGPTEMAFYQIASWEELKAGYQGIYEPEVSFERAFFRWLEKAEEETEKKPGRLSVRMLLPGAVFDRKGNRIGYGGGFYDRWLAKWNRFESGNPAVLEKIGLAYGLQVVKALPAEPFDQRVDRVITEKQSAEDWMGIGKRYGKD